MGSSKSHNKKQLRKVARLSNSCILSLKAGACLVISKLLRERVQNRISSLKKTDALIAYKHVKGIFSQGSDRFDDTKTRLHSLSELSFFWLHASLPRYLLV